MKDKLTLAKDHVAYKQIQGIENYDKTINCSNFLIVMFLEGSGIHYVNEEPFPILKNQLHFLFPGFRHHWVTGPETIAHKVVVGKKLFESFSSIDEFYFIKNNLSPVFRLSSTEVQAISLEIESIKRELSLSRKNNRWQKVIRLRMDILASIIKLQAEEYGKNTLQDVANPVIANFWKLIENNYTEQKLPRWYANKLGVTPNYLNMLCQKHMNTTATLMIRQRVMQEAKNLLKFSNKTIKEITYFLGFEGMPSFSTFFKKNCGFTPTEYRG